jgi:hypothetical protein
VSSVSDSLSLDTSQLEVREPAERASGGRPPRFVLPVVASVGLHLVVLVTFGLFFRFSKIAPQHDDSIPVTIIDLPIGGLAGGGGGSPIALRPAHHWVHHALAHAVIAITPRSVHHEPKMAKPIAKDAFNRTQPEFKHLSTSTHLELGLTGKSAAAPGTQKAIASNGSGGSGTGIGGGNGSGVGIGSGSGTGPGFGTGGSGPRAIYAPAPTIPDDMRDEVMHATAVARFEVSHDGRATVTLLTTTDYSELDDAILDTLKQWRFLPAIKNGVAIDSEADVRLLLSVQ